MPKKFAGEPKRCVINFDYRKILGFRGLCHDFSSFFLMAVPKNFAGNPAVLCFGKFPVANKFTDKREEELPRLLS